MELRRSRAARAPRSNFSASSWGKLASPGRSTCSGSARSVLGLPDRYPVDAVVLVPVDDGGRSLSLVQSSRRRATSAVRASADQSLLVPGRVAANIIHVDEVLELILEEPSGRSGPRGASLPTANSPDPCATTCGCICPSQPNARAPEPALKEIVHKALPERREALPSAVVPRVTWQDPAVMSID